jgi:hypothetical protein
MSLNISKPNLIFTNLLPGLGNYNSATFSVDIPSQSIAVSSYVKYTASTTLNNVNSVCDVQVQYSGLETVTRLCNGLVIVNVPAGVSPNYQIQSFNYFVGTTLFVDTIIANQTGVAQTIPAITVNCRGFLFNAPF